jgi:nitroimidazol reductase NimA-like FMN-containing flavoprotein (pyridoxamine 5'-phosphate oxidase superfamily)
MLEEIKALLKERAWGTLMTIDGNKPYGVELAYVSDDEYIYFGFGPDGRVAKCVTEKPNVAFKICEADVIPKRWRAVIIEGKAEKVMEREEIFRIIRSMAKGLELPEDYWDDRAEVIASAPEKSTLYRLPIKEVGGRCKIEG